MALECPRARRLPAPHQLPDGWCSGSPTGLEKQTVSKVQTPGPGTRPGDGASSRCHSGWGPFPANL